MDQYGGVLSIVQVNRFSALQPIKVIFEYNDCKIGVVPDHFVQHGWVKVSNRNGANS